VAAHAGGLVQGSIFIGNTEFNGHKFWKFQIRKFSEDFIWRPLGKTLLTKAFL
jgi:hypothetical protein